MPPQTEGAVMGTIIPFPRPSLRKSAVSRAPTRPDPSGIRVAYVAGRWCIERLADGIITGRTWMLTRADAERVMGRISRRDRLVRLPVHLLPQVGAPYPQCPYPDDRTAWH